MMADEGPLLIVGWDSASFDLLKRFDQDLETLTRIQTSGSYADLRTVYPPGTVPGWPCITTGLNPGKLNTQRLAPFRLDEFQPNTGEENLEIWDVVDHFGGTVCVVNMPSIVDPYDINGAMVSGFLSGEPAATTPSDLLDELEVDVRVNWEDVDREADIFTAAMDIAEERFKLVKELMKRYDWDLFVINFDAPDRIGHSRFKYIDPDHPFYTSKGARRYGDDLRQCFVRLDQMLAEMYPDAGNVFVVSDHGMDSCHWRFNINDWLIDHGYLVLNDEGSDPSSVTLALSYAKRLITEYGLVGLIPDILKRKSIVRRTTTSRHVMEVDVNWEETTAYMSAVYGGIDVIAKDREAIKRDLTMQLESIEKPSIRVIDSRELYHGPNIDNVPDLFLDFQGQVLPTNQVGAGSLLEPSSTGGKHSMDGIFAAAGPAIESTGQVEEASVLDIMPTALHLLGLPIPNYVDGSVLPILRSERDVVRKDLDIDIDKGGGEMADSERANVRERLEDIGYM